MLGCIWAAAVNRLVLPWYTSDWALEELAAGITHAAALLGQLHQLNLCRLALIDDMEQREEQQEQEQKEEQLSRAEQQQQRVVVDGIGLRISVQEVDWQQQQLGQGQGQNQPPLSPTAGGGGGGGATAGDGRFHPSVVHHHNSSSGNAQSNQNGTATATAGGGSSSGAAGDWPEELSVTALSEWEGRVLAALNAEVSGRLLGVRTSLQKDVVSWRKGLLVTPQVRGAEGRGMEPELAWLRGLSCKYSYDNQCIL